MTSRPSPEAMRLAAEWLDHYEADDRADAIAVAGWLREQADAAELRAECRLAGVPVGAARRALRKAEQ
jgi:hypothetical protein